MRWCVEVPGTHMIRTSTISTFVLILVAATAQAQNYPRFQYESEQILLNEFRKSGQQDWQAWRQQQDWRLQQADD